MAMKSYQKTPIPDYVSRLGSSMPLILDNIKLILNIELDTELADRLGFEYETIREWRRGITWPSKKSAIRLGNVIESRSWGDSKCLKEVFIAYNTMCFDAASSMYDLVACMGDAISLTSAVHSILAKVAFLIDSSNSINAKLQKKGIPVQKMHCVFGAPDYGEVMNVLYMTSEGKFSNNRADIMIKLAYINGKPKFVYQTELICSDKVERRFAGLVTDNDIDIISSKILKYITKNKQ